MALFESDSRRPWSDSNILGIKTGLYCLLMGRWMLWLAAGLAAQAQWIGYTPPNVPRTKEGKVDLAAKVPRLKGKPDLSGVWHVDPTRMDEWVRLLGANPNTLDVPGME